MRRNRLIALALIVVAIVIAVDYVGQLYLPVLEPAGPVAAGERRVMLITAGLAAIVVVPVFVLLFLFAWLFREGNEIAPRLRLPEWDTFGRKAEIIWWVMPTIIIALLSVVSWQTSHSLDPYEVLPSSGEALEVEVIALDWKWLFIYPRESIATVNELVIPVGRPVHFTLTADAPMNSFWIPALGGQIMVMPGMTTQLFLQADEKGRFSGFSANLSGKGFSRMTFVAEAVDPSAFSAWVQRVRATTSPLTIETYEALAEPSVGVASLTFSPADTRLYAHVVDSYMMGSMPAHPARSANQSMPDGSHDSHEDVGDRMQMP